MEIKIIDRIVGNAGTNPVVTYPPRPKVSSKIFVGAAWDRPSNLNG